MTSITSANAIIYLGIPDLFPTPQQIQGFAADDIFSVEPIESAELSMGVDGRLSAGFVFVPVKWGISVQADSESNFIFDQWYTAQQTAHELFPANGIVILTSIGSKWSLTRGFLTTYPPMPEAKRKLEARKYGITWESVLPALT